MAVSEAVLRQKVFIVLVTAAVGLVALAYAFIATPVYQVSSVLRPAALNELDALNRSEIYSLPPGEALTRVGAALESYETRLGFFRENQKLFRAFERPGRTLEQSFEEFNRNSISLSLPDPKKTDILSSFIRIEMNYPKDVDGVSILNGFVNYAINTEREHIAADLNVIVKNRLNELNGKLDAARSNYNNDKEARVASLQESNNLRRAQLRDELKALRAQLKTERYDRVAYLNEAIGIAKSLGIRKPTTPTSLGEADRAGSSTTMRTEVNNQQIPLYFMGTEALEAERSVLQQRKSDDFTAKRVGEIAKELQLLENNREIEILNSRQNEDIFLAGVQSLRAEAVRLQGLAIDMSRLKLVTIDKQALEPINPIKPNRKLIIIFGLLLGGVLGIAIVAIRSILSQQRAARPVLLVSNTVV
ncbi:MAG: chain-length determining protein [Pseudomonadales bacterium RIFCSPLOWO2_12_60_38]|nr:Wzz/FepE/Etk N-terminal domain-containing protein [Pseudomonas sp. PS02285]AOS73063.1 chain-length determining protein [Pseudomonas fluorescens]EPJ76994.1 putative chain length determinant protein [Pseudomonas sp. CFT9]EPL08986.1 putative chain length determinant protein [Pseudomonas sp. CF150]ETK41802.1 chain-length determining protein [Pseudomonas fluorescens FH5]KTC30395.1 chain-length determining protein [Pseudomonas sp. ICMP 19500]OHC32539.1 MAG: chain-length determining protein [Pseu